jgi:hypothetical protein
LPRRLTTSVITIIARIIIERRILTRWRRRASLSRALRKRNGMIRMVNLLRE